MKLYLLTLSEIILLSIMSKLRSSDQSSRRFGLCNEQNCWNENARIAVSYEIITDDDNYIFKHFVDIREQIKAREALDELLKEMCSNTWKDLQKRNKYQRGGFERISSADVKKSICKSKQLPTEADIIVFRFGGDKYRLLGYKRSRCHIFYILGYDFDYTAYDHG